MLDEKRWRKPGAVGVPITLEDGQAWLFPKPKVGLSALVVDGGSLKFSEASVRNFGPEYDALLNVFLEAEDGVTEAEALLTLAIDLLCRNYDLAPVELATLLPRWFNDEVNSEMWQAIANVALGKSPKPTPVG